MSVNQLMQKNEFSARERAVLQSVRQLLGLVEGQTNRIETLEGRVDKVETIVDQQVLLTNRQATIVRMAAAMRVRQLIGDDDYRSHSKQYFSRLYKEIYTRFAVPSYRDIPRKELNAVLKLIAEWQPIQAA
jgi:hypothetical protein